MHMYTNALNAPTHGNTARAATAAGPPACFWLSQLGMLRGASNGDGVLRSHDGSCGLQIRQSVIWRL
jgi:hypothetical protein